MLAAGGVLGLLLTERSQHDPQITEFLSRSGAVQRFRAKASGSRVRPPEVSALVVQAEAYARLLNPPREPEKLPAPAMMVRGDEAAGARDGGTASLRTPPAGVDGSDKATGWGIL